MKIDNTKAQMRKGLLELCILAIIRRKEVYASDIISILKKHKMIIVEGTLYPLLTRLKNEGLLEYYWTESRSGPPRKYYKITKLGERFLDELIKEWDELQIMVSKVMNEK